MKSQRGISLVEVMIVIVLIAVIATYALPWYGDYQRRSVVAEGIGLTAIGKAEVQELVSIGQLTVRGHKNTDPYLDPTNALGAISFSDNTLHVLADNPTELIRAVVRLGTVVIVTYKNELLPSADGALYSLVLFGTPSSTGGVDWDCLAGDRAKDALNLVKGIVNDPQRMGSPLPAKLAPAVCESKGVPSKAEPGPIKKEP